MKYGSGQKGNTVSDLFKRIQRIRQIFLLIGIVTACLTGILGWRLSYLLSEKYLISSTIIFVLLISVILLITVRLVAQFATTSLSRLAARLDTRYGLKERLSTWTELPEDHPFRNAIASEAADKITGISVFYGAQLSQFMAPPITMALFLMAVLLLPCLPVPSSVTHKQEEIRVIRHYVSKLQKQIETWKKEPVQNPELLRLMKELEQTARQLQKPNVTRKKALKELNALQQKLQQAAVASQKFEIARLRKQLSVLKGNPLAVPENARAVSHHLKQALQDETLTPEQLKNWEKAIQDFEAAQESSRQRLARLEEELEKAKEGIGKQKVPAVYDSRLKKRDLEKQKGGVQDGPGSTNEDIGPNSFDTKKKSEGEYARDLTRLDYEQLYQGGRIEAEKDPLFLKSEWGENIRYTDVRTSGAVKPVETGSVLQTLSLQNSGESAMAKEKIPQQYRTIAQKYLESIQNK